MSSIISGQSGFIGKAVSKKKHFTKVKNILKLAPGELQNIRTIVHTIGRAHVLKESSANPLAEFREVNVDITVNLAKQAAEVGVQRFIYVSSIGVNGETSTQPFTDLDIPSPQKDYAISKHEAEIALMEIADKTDLEVTIIRPPLVYGPNAPGNFGRLVEWVKQGKPLPLGAIKNQRSFIALDNLVDFIIHCIDHPKAGNETFVISDDEDVSTTEFIHHIANGLGTKPRLLPVPAPLLRAGLNLLGKQDTATSLLDNLQIDNSKARALLNWTPPISMAEQMQKLKHL